VGGMKKMGNIVPISVNNLIQATQYVVLGSDADLSVVYKGNGKEYVVESTIEDEKYTISSNLVDSIVYNTKREKEEILNIMYVIHRAYESYRTSKENEVLGMDLDLLNKGVTYLAGKYNIDSLIAYLEEMDQTKLVSLFMSVKQYESIIGELDEEFKNASYSEYESEERDFDYDGVVYDEEVIEYPNGVKVFLRK